MNRKTALFAAFLCLCIGGVVYPDEPLKPLAATQINAPASVQGNGTRDVPYVFSLGSKGDLRLAAATEKVTWELKDAPADTEILPDGKRLWFPTDTPGLYVAAAAWQDGDKPGVSLCWFEIKGPNGPPQPVPANQLAAKLKAILVGPDAKADAGKLAGLCGAIADALDAGQFKTMGELGAAWKSGQAASQWPPGKYSGMPDLIRTAVPIADETNGPVPIDATNRPSFVANLRLIEKTARAIANG